MPRLKKPKRAFIIHGSQSYPEEAWFPWLKRELTKRGYKVAVPALPHPDRPSMPEWLQFITKLVGEPDRETVMIGHSLGCQAVLRYLELVGAAGKSIRTTVMVAGGFPPEMTVAEAKAKVRGVDELLPWFTLGVDAKKVKAAMGRCTVILSDDDPYIPLQKAIAGFRTNLRPKIVIEKGRGHFNEDDDITELPSALQAAIE